MKLIGLTGGIGSGKSTVAEIFLTLGIPVYESDARAKVLMESDPELKKAIVDLLGPESYSDQNGLNRSWIASQVFSNEKKLDDLNAIVHPAVYTDLLNWSQEKKQTEAPYLIQESAILFEENLLSRLKAVILVVADAETRIARVMKRDNVSRDKVLSRMNHQWPDVQKIPHADFVIYNDGKQSLIEQVIDIDRMIKILFTGVESQQSLTQ